MVDTPEVPILDSEVLKRFESLYQNHLQSDFILETWPKPSSTNSLSDSDEWMYAINLISGEPELGSICALIDVDPLLRPGDYIEEFQNISFWLDGRAVQTVPTQLGYEESTALLDDKGNIVASGDTEIVTCWDIPISPGKHVADISVWTSTEEEYHYAWVFEITE